MYTATAPSKKTLPQEARGLPKRSDYDVHTEKHVKCIKNMFKSPAKEPQKTYQIHTHAPPPPVYGIRQFSAVSLYVFQRFLVLSPG